MKVLRIHNLYQVRGGEDVVSESEIALLRAQGCEVSTVLVSNNEIPTIAPVLSRIQLAGSTIWSRKSQKLVRASISRLSPDVVHFDNTFPLISPAAYSAVNRNGVPVVQTLHNFRLLCPNALFYRDGHVCEDCLGKTPPYPGVVHACYRDSHAQTAVVASMLTFHRLRRTWTRDVDRYIALNPFSRRKFIEGGLPEERVVVKPNFVDGPVEVPGWPRRSELVNVGRLSEEKGVATLFEAWLRHTDLPPLEVIGDGPMMDDARGAAGQRESLRLLGRQPREVVMAKLATASALVFPSVCYENFPVAIAEAFANGTPVIASRLGAMAELVEDGVTGLLFTPGDPDDLAAKIRWASQHPDELRRMGENARREYEAKYTPERNYEMLMEIYHDAIDHARRRDA